MRRLRLNRPSLRQIKPPTWRGIKAWSRRRRLVTAAVTLLVLGGAIVVVAAITAAPSIRTRSQFVAGTSEPASGSTPAAEVELDTTLYLPQHTPAPAVLLAHGFGGSKDELAGPARTLARHGYVVLAYTARGFGRSGGLIHLDAPKFEVADASKLITYLATLPQVEKDGPGNPRVAVAGSSYGGALALLTAAYDHRVDAVAADITWNSLTTALFPNDGRAGTATSGRCLQETVGGLPVRQRGQRHWRIDDVECDLEFAADVSRPNCARPTRTWLRARPSTRLCSRCSSSRARPAS